jgi:tetrahydromethanopterin S-methyltransferase subunit G
LIELVRMSTEPEDVKGIKTRLDGIDSRLNNLDARVGRIEADVHVLRDAMVHRQEFHDVRHRITSVEKTLGAESRI